MRASLYILASILLAISAFAGELPATNASAFGDGLGVNGTVFAIAAQPDGKILIGGQFNAVNGIQRLNLARLNPDGTLDASFLPKPTDGTNGPVFALGILVDGRILVGGMFSEAATIAVNNLALYGADGALDRTFGEMKGPNGRVLAIAVQPDGKFVIGGEFNEVGPQPRHNLARFNADASLDAALSAASTTTGSIAALGVQPDGSLVAGGDFTVSARSSRNLLQISPAAGH